ncbi:MAG TPA: hypothetical protein ENG55_02730, partial [Candidatus Omnitrophica bacterium]|nr:hypothetical protein [Candidatus Omnitrophota bacterium]
PFRQDILREADLIEEVVRVYGYDKIPSTLVKVSSRQIKEYKSTPNVTESFKYKAKQMIRNILISCGLNEVISYSLIDKEDLKTLGFKSEDIIHIRNPLSREQAVLRPTLVAGLLSVINWNLNRQIKDVSIFEMGKVFSAGHKTGIKEEEKVGICLCGNKFLNDWQMRPRLVNFFDLKGILESLFNNLGLTKYKLHHFNNQFFIKGQAAKVSLDNEDIAIIGKVDEDILRRFDVKGVVYIAEIDIEKILPLLKITHKMESIPKYPHIVRDLALIVKEELESQTIINKIKKIGRPLVTEVTLFDVYRGKQIPPGYKSLAYSIKYQSYKRTLIDDEVDKIQQEIQRILVEDLKAQIR